MKMKLNNLIDPDELYLLGLRNIEEKRDLEAILILDKLTSTNPHYSDAQALLGWLIGTSFGDFKQAKIFLEIAYNRTPDNQFVVENYIIVLRRLNEIEAALGIIEISINRYKLELPGIYYELGVIREKEKRLDEAIRAFKLALEKSDEHDETEYIITALNRCEAKHQYT